jgi:hypothetical protein
LKGVGVIVVGVVIVAVDAHQRCESLGRLILDLKEGEEGVRREEKERWERDEGRRRRDGRGEGRRKEEMAGEKGVRRRGGEGEMGGEKVGEKGEEGRGKRGEWREEGKGRREGRKKMEDECKEEMREE